MIFNFFVVDTDGDNSGEYAINKTEIVTIDKSSVGFSLK